MPKPQGSIFRGQEIYIIDILTASRGGLYTLVHYLGLKTLVSIQSTRQLDEVTSASLALTWQPDLGPGLQLSTSRQLTNAISGQSPRSPPFDSLGMRFWCTASSKECI